MNELPFSGKDWQDWADKLLQRYYGPAEYQKVPDKDKGDAGIEGFTILSGHAYQAYGTEEPVSTKARYENQRNKISKDIKKFIDNKQILTRLLGKTKIEKWILFVPIYTSKDLIIHANKKTEEVRKANLPYASPNFRVCIEDEKAFSVERDELLNIGEGKFAIKIRFSGDEEIGGWAETNSDLVKVVDDKANRLPKLISNEMRLDFRNQVIKHFLDGQNTLENLRQYPYFYEQCVRIKSNRERFLEIESMTTTDNSMAFLNRNLDKLQEEINHKVKTLPSEIVDTLKWEAVADWIIRCPLDFE